jgi:hypothetical protein
MKLILSFTSLFLLVASTAFSQSNQVILEGKIDTYDVLMTLTIHASIVEGHYEYPGRSQKLNVSGILNANNEIELTEANPSGQVTGYFSGIVSEDRITGVWSNAKKTKQHRFNLDLIEGKFVQNQSRLNEAASSELSDSSGTRWWIWIIIASLGLLVLIISKKMRGGKQQETKHNNITTTNQAEPETIQHSQPIDNHGIGREFEKFVGEKFSVKKEYFKILEYTSDQNFDGLVVQSNMNPDFLMEFNNVKSAQKQLFAVECKYRSKVINKMVNVIKDEHQLERYRKYQKERDVLFFVVLGLEGSPKNPHEIFIIPLEDINQTDFEYNDLLRYKKNGKREYFFYDFERRTLNI